MKTMPKDNQGPPRLTKEQIEAARLVGQALVTRDPLKMSELLFQASFLDGGVK